MVIPHKDQLGLSHNYWKTFGAIIRLVFCLGKQILCVIIQRPHYWKWDYWSDSGVTILWPALTRSSHAADDDDDVLGMMPVMARLLRSAEIGPNPYGMVGTRINTVIVRNRAHPHIRIQLGFWWHKSDIQFVLYYFGVHHKRFIYSWRFLCDRKTLFTQPNCVDKMQLNVFFSFVNGNLGLVLLHYRTNNCE